MSKDTKKNDTPEVGEIELDETAETEKKSQRPNDDSNAASDLKKLKSEYLYLRAEFDNFRKNTIKERSDLIKYGAERFVVPILRVLDFIELALQTEVTPENYKEFVNGVEMTANEFKQVIGDMGVQEIDPTGEPFDPNMHEALSSEESAEVEPGHVLRVFKKAFKLHDKVVRPAQVVVARAPEERSED